MAQRGRPRKVERTLEEVLRLLTARDDDRRWTVGRWKEHERNRLVGDLLWYAERDIDSVHAQLELPVQFDLDHGRGWPPRRKPAYRFLFPDAVVTWVERLQARGITWQREPVLEYHISRWQKELSGRCGSAEGARLRSTLRRIDPHLIPHEARGAGRRGNDDYLCGCYEDRLAILQHLRARLRCCPEANRSEPLSWLLDTVVAEGGEACAAFVEALEWELWTELEGWDRIAVEPLRKEVIRLLGVWLPPAPTSPSALAYPQVAKELGPSEETVRKAVKRARRKSLPADTSDPCSKLLDG
ncbi:MAG: hypothetical protein WDA75_11730 [Candidatus Latescibacterota bacterium]|jgi:hypothetical protein